MDNTRISALGTLGETFSILGREKQLALLLVAFLSVITIIFLWPVLGWYVTLLTDFSTTRPQLDPAATQQMMDNLAYIFIAYIPFMFFMLAPLVLWSRASIGGAKVAMEGGIGLLLKRTLWLIWRYICLLGWVLLFSIAFLVIMTVIGIIFGISGTSFSAGDPQLAAGDVAQALVALFIPLYLIFISAMVAAMLLFSVSLHGEARDLRLPIYKSFIAMKGNFLRATDGLLLAMIGFYVVYFLFALLFMGAIMAASTWLTIIGLFILFALGNIYNFIWISYGAIYASKLVPELKG